MGKFKKPEPFMGAFLQTQFEFNCFDLNVKIPSMNEVTPFSRILTASTVQPVDHIIEIDENNREAGIKSLSSERDESESSSEYQLLRQDGWSVDQNLDVSHIQPATNTNENYQEE